MEKRKEMILGVIFISFAAILWGLDGVILTPRLFNLEVGYVVFMLHLIPFVLMNLIFKDEYKKLKEFSKKDIITFLLIAVFGGALGTLAIVKALFLVNFQALTIVVLLQKLQPVFAILLARILLKEKIKKNIIKWGLLAMIAGYFLTFNFSMPNMSSDSNMILAALYALLAAFSFGSATVLGKSVISKYDFKTVVFYRYGFTSLIMFVYIIYTKSYLQIFKTTKENWIVFLIITFTTGSVAMLIYYLGLKKIKANVATICELFFPISAIFFDYIINGNVLSSIQWVSAGVMIFSIMKLTLLKK